MSILPLSLARSQDQNGVLSKEEIDAVPKGDQDIMEGNAEVRILDNFSCDFQETVETSRDI